MKRTSGEHFGAVYVTLASVLLGLALDDLVSIVRAVETRDSVVWIEAVFVVHIIMNAWIAYTSTVTRLRLELHPWDAMNVFGLSAAHFAINSFVGGSVPAFLTAVGIYSITAAATVHGASVRGRRDPDFDFPSTGFRPVVALNLTAAVVFLFLALASTRLPEKGGAHLVFVSLCVPYATLWLAVFWRCWRRGAPHEPDSQPAS